MNPRSHSAPFFKKILYGVSNPPPSSLNKPKYPFSTRVLILLASFLLSFLIFVGKQVIKLRILWDNPNALQQHPHLAKNLWIRGFALIFFRSHDIRA